MLITTAKTFESSWAALKQAVVDGSIRKVLHSGDKIPVTLKNGEEAAVIATYDENGKLFFVFDNCLRDFFRMNPRFTNDGAWAGSEMRGHMEKVFELLPDDLHAVIETTHIVPTTAKPLRATTSCSCCLKCRFPASAVTANPKPVLPSSTFSRVSVTALRSVKASARNGGGSVRPILVPPTISWLSTLPALSATTPLPILAAWPRASAFNLISSGIRPPLWGLPELINRKSKGECI